MVRFYVRKTQRGQGRNWEMAPMIAAMNDVKGGETNIRRAAIMYNVPESTLQSLY